MVGFLSDLMKLKYGLRMTLGWSEVGMPDETKAFDGPYGKALAAYLVTQSAIDWSTHDMKDEGYEGNEEVNVSNWGAVYDEMYKETDHSISNYDPTLNWSGYTDTYSRRPHIEPVIKEWVEWSCEQVVAHQHLLLPTSDGRVSTITELGCGNGMLLFRLAPLLDRKSVV